MVADLVNEDVGDDVAEGFLVLCPVVEDRAAVEGDAVRHFAGLDGEALADAATFEEAEQVEGRFQRHVLENVVARKFCNLDDEVARQRTEFFRQVAIGLQRQGFERADGRGVAGLPILGLVNAGHRVSFARHIDDFPHFSRVEFACPACTGCGVRHASRTIRSFDDGPARKREAVGSGFVQGFLTNRDRSVCRTGSWDRGCHETVTP